MGKKTETNEREQLNNERQDHLDKYLADWNEAREQLDALLSPRDFNGDPIPLNRSLLADAQRKVEKLKLQFRIFEAAVNADVLLCLRDVEAGEPDAVASDLDALLEKIDAVVCNPADDASVMAARRQIGQLIADAHKAHDRYAARRSASNLPARQAWPTPRYDQRPVDAIRARAAGEIVETTDYPGQIRLAEIAVREILLRDARALEKEEADKQAAREAAEAEAKRHEARAKAEAASRLAQIQADQKRLAEEDEIIRRYLGVTCTFTDYGTLH